MLEPRTLSVAKKGVEAAVSAAISYGCGRHARRYINFAISPHASQAWWLFVLLEMQNMIRRTTL